MIIKVLSRNTVKALLEKDKSNEQIEKLEYLHPYIQDIDPAKCLFISINNYASAPDFDWPIDPKTHLELPPIPKEYLDRSLVLHFDDVVEGCINPNKVPYKIFNGKMADSIVNFLKHNLTQDITHIVAHCTAGISRSGAVGTVLNDYYNKFLEDNPEHWHKFQYSGHPKMLDPNPTVSRYLRRKLGMSYNDSETE